jgi:hypothetical protein
MKSACHILNVLLANWSTIHKSLRANYNGEVIFRCQSMVAHTVSLKFWGDERLIVGGLDKKWWEECIGAGGSCNSILHLTLPKEKLGS